VRVYDGQLRGGGILLFHVSNRFYELRPVLARVAEAVGYRMVWKQRGAGEVAREAGVVVEDPSMYVAMWPSQPAADRWGPALEARGWRTFDASGYRDPGLFRDDYAPSLRALRVLMR
jgi:hypothetical protein